MPRPTAPKLRETGPRPLRTARGAGRLLLDRVRPAEVRRDREVELFDFGLAFDFEDLDEDVLLLRDPGGEDVRVAMLEG